MYAAVVVWVPVASAATTAPTRSNTSSRVRRAGISLLFASTCTCPSTTPQRVVQGGDQMRRDIACGPGAADRLAVDRDDPPPAEQTDAGAHPRSQHGVEQLPVDTGQCPAWGEAPV